MTGSAGATGAAGATGPTGVNGLSQYAYVYNLKLETVGLGGSVTFDSNGYSTSGITHVAGTAPVNLVNAGVYKITFSASGTASNQIALFVNEVFAPGTVYGSGAGTQQNTGFAILQIPAAGVLTMRNYISSAALEIATPIGGTQESTNASLAIEKLG